MKLYEAKNIITEVFENTFDKDKFSYFIRNLLKNIQPAEFLRTGYNIPKAFEDFIASYERLGKYEDEEGNLIDVLIVKLKRNHSKETPPTLQHIYKPARADAQTKGLQKSCNFADTPSAKLKFYLYFYFFLRN